MFFELKKETILIFVKVKTKAQKEGVLQVQDDYLQIGVNLPPIQGKANQRVREILSKWLSLPQSDVSLIRGLKGKLKVFEIPNNYEIKAKLTLFNENK